jgi:hypothetical protein
VSAHRLAGIALAALALACGPMGPLSGGKLDGERVTTPVGDWSFSDASDTVALETNPDDPYSVNVWFVRRGATVDRGRQRRRLEVGEEPDGRPAPAPADRRQGLRAQGGAANEQAEQDGCSCLPDEVRLQARSRGRGQGGVVRMDPR